MAQAGSASPLSRSLASSSAADIYRPDISVTSPSSPLFFFFFSQFDSETEPSNLLFDLFPATDGRKCRSASPAAMWIYLVRPSEYSDLVIGLVYSFIDENKGWGAWLSPKCHKGFTFFMFFSFLNELMKQRGTKEKLRGGMQWRREKML